MAKIMRVSSQLYIVLLFFSYATMGIEASGKFQDQGNTIEYHHNKCEYDYGTYQQIGGIEKQWITTASLLPGHRGSAIFMQTSGTVPLWWSIWFYTLLIIITGTILIYFYLEYSRKIVSVSLEIEELKENNKKLNEELAGRINELEYKSKQLKKAEAELVEKSQKAEMAEIAAGVLHNVSNVLSSVNSSNTSIWDTVKNSKVDGLIKANQILRENIDHFDQYIINDSKGKTLLMYYLKLEEPLRTERNNILKQSERLDEKISIINDVITAQQFHTRSAIEITETSINEIVETTLSIHYDLVNHHDINITKELYAEIPVLAQRSKLIHVLLNFLKNAAEAMHKNHPENKSLTIKSWQDSYKVYLSVSDNGAGIKAENVEKIFSHTYTTKNRGHGFGLHSSATYMNEIGGKIEVSSEGKGMGTTFTLVFPILREKKMFHKS